MARHDDSAQLFIDALADEVSGRWLVAEDDLTVSQALTDRGAEVVRWNRYALGDQPASAAPPEGRFDRAVLSLPRGRPAYGYALEMLASRLDPGSRLFVYGSNDFGVKTAHKALSPWFEDHEKLDARKHGRLLSAVRSEAPARGSVEHHGEPVVLELPAGPASFTNLPGLFAKGELDQGTELLLRALEKIDRPDRPMRRALDFASGMGVLSMGVKQRWPGCVVHALDADALAVEATRMAVPDATVALGDGYAALTGLDDVGRYDLIISNPPIHRGTRLDMSILEELVTQAPRWLQRRRGKLVLVVQRQRPIPEIPGRTPQLLADDGRFRVWKL